MNEFANVEAVLNGTTSLHSLPCNLYEVLGVKKSAKPHDIRNRYHQLARRLHPDIRPGDAEAEHSLKIVNAAYEILGSPTKRLAYDTWARRREEVRSAARNRFIRQQALVFTAVFLLSSAAFLGTLSWLNSTDSAATIAIAQDGQTPTQPNGGSAAEYAAEQGPPDSTLAQLAFEGARFEPSHRINLASVHLELGNEWLNVGNPHSPDTGNRETLAGWLSSVAAERGAVAEADVAPDAAEPPQVASTQVAGISSPHLADDALDRTGIEASYSFDGQQMPIAGRDITLQPESKTARAPETTARAKAARNQKRHERIARMRKPAGERGSKTEGFGGVTIVAAERTVSTPRPQASTMLLGMRMQTADEPFGLGAPVEKK